MRLSVASEITKPPSTACSITLAAMLTSTPSKSVPSRFGRPLWIPMRILGVGGFAPTGRAEFLYEYFGLDARSIAAAARELFV